MTLFGKTNNIKKIMLRCHVTTSIRCLISRKGQVREYLNGCVCVVVSVCVCAREPVTAIHPSTSLYIYLSIYSIYLSSILRVVVRSLRG